MCCMWDCEQLAFFLAQTQMAMDMRDVVQEILSDRLGEEGGREAAERMAAEGRYQEEVFG